METKKFTEIVYAYAAGCLDKEDYPELLDFINSGNTLIEGELGKLQNVITLLPAILETEHPDMRTKDKVARKLYRMREEVRTKKKPLEITTSPDGKRGKEEPVTETVQREKVPQATAFEIRKEKSEAFLRPVESKKLVDEVQYNELNDKTEFEEPKRPFRTDNKKDDLPDVDFSPAKKASQKDSPAFEKTAGRRGAGILTVILTALILSLLSGGAVYFLLSREIKKDKEQIAFLSSQVNGLIDESSRLSKNQKVLALLGAKDTRTFNLDGTLANTKGFGKLVMTPDGKEGLLQLYNMPVLAANQAYKLWAMVKGQPMPMGSFKPKRSAEYFPIDQLPADDFQAVDSFNVTLEQGEGVQSPSKDVFLSYAVKESKGKK